MAGCACNAGLGNTGTPNCFPIATVAKKLILVPTYKDDGTRNSIDLSTAALDAAELTALINNADASQRWFPVDPMENVTSERAESILESAPSGKSAFIKKGVRSFSGEIWSASPQLVGQLEKARCVDIAAYVVDNNGNIMGHSEQGSDLFYPIKIDKNSFDAKLVNGTDTTVQKVMVTFNWDDTERDEDVYMLIEDDYTFDILNASGLIDVYSTISGEATTGFVAKLTYIYGSKKSPSVNIGLVAGDFALYNETTSSAVTITTATESPDGTYTFVYAAQTSADVITLTPSLDGFDYTNVISNQIVTP